MSDFAGLEDILQDFLVEGNELLNEVENHLVELENKPKDLGLLTVIFRGFHTIKGGAGFLNATELVKICHLTETLFDLLRSGELTVTGGMMDVILEATAAVREMFVPLGKQIAPAPASPELMEKLEKAVRGEIKEAEGVKDRQLGTATNYDKVQVNWSALYRVIQSLSGSQSVAKNPDGASEKKVAAASIEAQPKAIQQTSAPSPTVKNEPTAQKIAAQPPVTQKIEAASAVPAQASAQQLVAQAKPAPASVQQEVAKAEAAKPASPARVPTAAAAAAAAGGAKREPTRENSIRVDTARLDQVLNLSGEIGLTKNRLNALRSDILSGKTDTETLHNFDTAVSQLDILVSDLQNAVMKTRMQPIGRLFQKYPRIVRDLARTLGKDIEVVLSGEETEIDKTMIEDLSDPIVHLLRNAADHGVESPMERLANSKPEKGTVKLEARQEGDHILILISDDGRGMNPERLREKALEKGLITEEEANRMDEKDSFNLIFLPGFSTASQVSDVSGRGVGMDVVKTNIGKLNGTIDIKSVGGKGTTFVISLPLTLAILQVLLVRLGDQPFAVPLSLVREILPIEADEVQEVGGRATMVVRGEVLPVLPLTELINWPAVQPPAFGVLMQTAELSFILAVDSFAGRDDAVIKSLDDFRPKGVAGVTTLSNGQIVLILDMKELLANPASQTGVSKASLLPENVEIKAA